MALFLFFPFDIDRRWLLSDNKYLTGTPRDSSAECGVPRELYKITLPLFSFQKGPVCGVVKQFLRKENTRCSPEVHAAITYYMFIRACPAFRARECTLPPSRMAKTSNVSVSSSVRSSASLARVCDAWRPG